MYASYNGNKNIVKLLLNKSANVNKTDRDGNSALSLANKQGHIDIIELLTKHSKWYSQNLEWETAWEPKTL